MRLAFCFLSNNIHNMYTNLTNIDFNLKDLTIQSYTKNILITPPSQYINRMVGWNVQYKTYHWSDAFDMYSMRQDSLLMAGNADLIYVGDDDMKFNEGWTEVIHECALYMLLHPDCGAIYLGGDFGGEGKKHGNSIYITNNGHLGTNRGILVRNRYAELLDNNFHALGANFDFMIGFTCLLQGYYVARRLNVPIEHDTKNKISEDNENINYNLGFLRTRGIMAKVNLLIGEWSEHSIWPKNIFTIYRVVAREKWNWQPRYTTNGEIVR